MGLGGVFKKGVKPGHILVICLLLIVHQGLALKNRSGAKLRSEENGDEEEEIHHFQVFHLDFEHTSGPFIIAFWIFSAGLIRVVFHMIPKLHQILPESCILIVYGIVIGFVVFFTTDKPPITFTPELFFLFLLPLIIFDAGYFMPNRMFFEHLGTVLLMAVIGTIWNMLTIGGGLIAMGKLGLFGDDPPELLETFLFSSLISAVDPVAVLALFEEIKAEEIIYIVVFGESLLNDAVTVVLYDMFESFVEIGEDNINAGDVAKGLFSFFVVALGGTLVGIIWGYVAGFITRFTSNASILEPLLVFAMAFLSYYTAEMFKLSAILSITFCGITMKNYVERNISKNSQISLKYLTKMMASASETVIFIFLGIVTVQNNHDWNWGFVGFTILFASLFRALGVLIFAAFANRFRLYKLGPVDQFIMMYGGMRGGVAFALVLLVDSNKVPHAPMFVTTTIAVVFWTSFVQGITIKPLVQMMGVKTMEEKNPTMNERIGVRFMDHAVSAIVGVIGEFDGQRQRNMYRNFDDKYIKPWILRDPSLKDPKILETFQSRIEDDALTFMNKNPTEITKFEYALETKQKLPSLEGKKSTGSVTIDITSKPRSSKDYTDSEMHDILSESMVQPQRRRRISSTRLSVNESDIIEEAVEPTVTRHQVKQAARRMSTKKSMDSSDNLPVVVEEKDVEPNDAKEGYDNAAFDHETEDLKEEDKVLKDLDKVIDNVPLSSIE